MDVEYPELDFGATGTTRKQVEQIPIIDLTTEYGFHKIKL